MPKLSSKCWDLEGREISGGSLEFRRLFFGSISEKFAVNERALFLTLFTLSQKYIIPEKPR